MISENMVYLLSFITILFSPILFMITKKYNWSRANWMIIALLFVSWLWAINYKLTPKLYFPESLFFIMIFVSTIMVWISSYFLLAFLVKMRTGVRRVVIFFLVAISVLFTFFTSEIPTNMNSLTIFYGRFHIYFVTLLILSSLSGWAINKVTHSKNMF